MCPRIFPSAEGVVMETDKDSLAPTAKVWSLPWGKEGHKEGKKLSRMTDSPSNTFNKCHQIFNFTQNWKVQRTLHLVPPLKET